MNNYKKILSTFKEERLEEEELKEKKSPDSLEDGFYVTIQDKEVLYFKWNQNKRTQLGRIVLKKHLFKRKEGSVVIRVG